MHTKSFEGYSPVKIKRLESAELRIIIDPILQAVKGIILGKCHDDLPVIEDTAALLKSLLKNTNPCYLQAILQIIEELVNHETYIEDTKL